ncbi:hypothetical protein QEH40_gp13 [Microbacterium phage OscarSo]|uniref:Uncharacterized protein n=1 Tax=Microbacterium phage OscarSo TaxID=2985324 RepID=A0A9X9K512_9CAUD|nr:hypothetical protein QEH40_gp13 [Microbacterium phage OscarSo]UYL87134.1 hypothetical protein SEA_OSCARSO_13 [Microbacterium phage OscarSo]
MSDPDALPTERLYVQDPDNAGVEILAFLGKLAAEGKRPWCEVFYPAPARLAPVDRADWEKRQLDHFDAVELMPDGQVVTLPPYAEITEGASS